MLDSVFSQFSDQNPPQLTKQEKKINADLDKIESAAAKNLRFLLQRAAQKLTKKLESAFSLRDVNAINSSKWDVLPELSRSLWGLWLLGWGQGTTNAESEIKSLGKAEFDQGHKGVRYRAITNPNAETAIKDRINQLAIDVNNSEFDRIKQHLLAAVTPQSEDGQPIDRLELQRRINSELGEKASRFKNRAETIARTELTFAYNAGRLQSYRDSGLVESVMYMSLEDPRRCPICSSRQGIVIPLNDARAIASMPIPAHPNCRCVWSPILADPKGRKLQQDPDRQVENRSIVPAPAVWMSAAILAAILLGSVRMTKLKLKTPGKLVVVPKVSTPARKSVELIDKVTGIAGIAGIAAISSGIGSVTNGQKIAEPSQSDRVLITPPPQNAVVAALPSPIIVGGIDLKTATAEQLRNLFPPRQLTNAQIQKIIAYRDLNGIDSIEDLRRVPGIGLKTVERFKALYEVDLPVNVFINQVKSPVQLWATNLGLTRDQARTIFTELQTGGQFTSLDNFRQRLKNKGIGEKTVQTIQQKAVLIQSQIQSNKRIVPQSVGQGSGENLGRNTTVIASTPPAPPSPGRRAASANTEALAMIRSESANIANAVTIYDEQASSSLQRLLSRKVGVETVSTRTLNQSSLDLADNSTGIVAPPLVDEIDNLAVTLDDLETQLRTSLSNDDFVSVQRIQAQLAGYDTAISQSADNTFVAAAQLRDRRSRLESIIETASRKRRATALSRQSTEVNERLDRLMSQINELEQVQLQRRSSRGRSQTLNELQALKQTYNDLKLQSRPLLERQIEYLTPTITALDRSAAQLTDLAEQFEALRYRLSILL